jgi:hypothetical protein
MFEEFQIKDISKHLDEIIEVELKAEDKREVEAASGRSSSLGLLQSIVCSEEAWCLNFNSKPIAYWGYVQVSETVAAPWLLTTESIWDKPVVLYRKAKKFIEALPYETMYVSVWVDNKPSFKLLEALGFKKTPFILRHKCPDTPFHCLVRSR